MSNKKSFLTRLFLPTIVITCLAVSARAAAPLADKVPADAVLYIGWAGADSQATAYQGSDLRAFVDGSNLRDLVKEYQSSLDVAHGLAEAGNDDAKLMETGVKLLPMLWHHPVAMYAADVTVSPDGTPSGDLEIICDAGSDAAQLQADLDELVKGNTLLHVSAHGSVVAIGHRKSTDAPVIACLDNDPRFIAAMAKLQSSPALAVYVDAKTLMLKADRSAEKDPDGAEVWPKVRDALGVTYVTSYAMTAGFDGTRWMTASRLEAPQPRTGLLAAIEPQPIDPLLLARIPASAGSVSVCNLDLAKVYDTLADVMAVRDQSNKVFHQVSGAMTVVLGRNLRKAILGTLGSQWVVYCDSKQPCLTLLNHPIDPDAAGDSLVSAAFGIINEVNTTIPGASTKPVVTASQQTIKDVDLTTAVTPYSAPSFAVKGKVLYVGPTPESVGTAATRTPLPPPADIVHSRPFLDAVKRLDVPTFAAFRYCDLPTTAPGAYESFPDVVERLTQLAAKSDLQLPELKLPPLDQVESHLSPALWVSWSDRDGLNWKSISPFPGSVQLLADPSEIKILSKLTAMLIPAIEKANSHHAEPARAVPE